MGAAGEAFIAAVDALMGAPKTLQGVMNPRWQESRDAYAIRLKLPIQVGDEMTGQFLMIDAFPDRQHLQFTIALLVEGRAVCRLDYDPEVIHDNGWADGLPGMVKGPHWHSWEVNRDAFRKLSSHPVRLQRAIPFTQARAFDACLRWYCQERNIALGAHAIDFPASATLPL